MIVKVQLSMATSHENQRVLVYNKNKSVWYEGDASKKLIKQMGGRFKMFFKAKMEKDKSITLIKPAKSQDW